MRLHYLQHVEFEDAANIKKWAESENFTISCTKLYENQDFPRQEEFDFLVIMGGSMNIYEENLYPWLKTEKEFIKKSIENNKSVLGICLGAQLIADVLGAKVYKNSEKEIGWFPVNFSEKAVSSGITNGLPKEIMALHWHGDTFEIPHGCIPLATSEACQNQGFLYKDNVAALQFHLETSDESLNKLIENCKNELVQAKFIQSAEFMLNDKEKFKMLEKNLRIFLNNFVKKNKFLY